MMSKANRTLRDVAKLAKVSISTASRALSGNGVVHSRTESRVRDAAAQLHYQPNTLARGLKTRSSRLIGLLIHNLVATSFCVLAETAQKRFGAAGYQVLLGITGDDAEQEERFLASIENYRAEGLIIIPTGRNAAALARLERSGIPIVAAIRSQPDMDLETILQADAEGACAATRYLLEIGHRRIGCIVGRDDTTSGRERRVGYIRAYHEFGLVPDPQLIFAGPYEPETGFRGSSYLMNLSPRPTALFVANQEAAMGVIKFLSDHDTKIPDELSLICYENIPWLQWQKPAISIVDNNSQTIADLAVDGLMRRLSQVSDPLQPAEPPRNLRVEARLVLRDSCTPPRLQE